MRLHQQWRFWNSENGRATHGAEIFLWRRRANPKASSFFHKSINHWLPIYVYQVGGIILKYICCFLYCIWYMSLFFLILTDVNVIKKATWKRKLIGKSAVDQILAKSKTDHFHEILKLIKMGDSQKSVGPWSLISRLIESPLFISVLGVRAMI